MKLSKHLISLTTFLLLFAFVPQSYADISSAALLYLRIAPGARAAGMGEAFVAVADDASSTHWNPAGLGSNTLSTNWQNKDIPANLQPIQEMTTLKARGGSGHNQFDIWTISAEGLARFDNHAWFTYETFQTKTNQTVASIVKNYFSIEDEDELAIAVNKVALANSERSIEEVETFSAKVLEAIGEDYSDREAIVSGFDSLKTSYFECRINWSRYTEIEDIFNDGIKDEKLSEKEIDRINFAVEKSKTRFIPEELKIKYSDLFSGTLTTIKSLGTTLLIGTENGFYTFNGKKWVTYNMEDGLPSMNIVSIATVGAKAFIGTDKGLVTYSGKTLEKMSLPSAVGEATVAGIGGANNQNVWAVLNGELYRYNGKKWSNSHYYTAVIDDSYETIAEKVSIFKTASEITTIAQRIKDLNTGVIKEDVVEEIALADSSVLEETIGIVANSNLQEVEKEVVPESVNIPSEFTIEPGKPVAIPYAIGIKGEINKIYSTDAESVWLATDMGLYILKEGEWKASGYKTVVVEAEQSFETIASVYPHELLEEDAYISLIKDINGLDDAAILTAGDSIMIYRNPLALEINDITSKGAGLFIATKKGLYELLETTLSPVDIGGMGESNILNVKLQGNEIWFASDEKIAIKASGRSDIVMMFAKWLPQLADDMYYGFLSGATNISGWGTVGGNITYINYGTVNRTTADNQPDGVFYPFDISFTLSYGGALRENLKGGVSAKLIYSHLSLQGAGSEKGAGTATGVGLDFGLLWNLTKTFDIGAAITNLGPDISYIDAGQSDPLPRNFALGFKADLLNSEYYHTIITAEVNKSLVGLDDGFSEEIKQLVINGGIEFAYAGIFAARAGYIWDDEGDVKTPTLGFGVSPLENFKFDFAYIPSNTNAPLANTLRISMQILP